MEEKNFLLEDFAGRRLKVSFSRLAEQAGGSCLVQYGDTVVLATATMGKSDKEDSDFFPLTVEYEEKFYAAGKILGSRFVRREGKASESAILSGRLIDRTIRPLFDQRLRREIQIVTTVLAFDGENDPDFPALFGASLAISCSNIPHWNGPISGIRIGKRNGELIVNPTYKEKEESGFDVFISGIENKINMMEIGTNEESESEIVRAIKKGQEEIEKLNNFQKEIIAKMPKPKAEVKLAEINAEFLEKTKKFLVEDLEKSVFSANKIEMEENFRKLKEKMKIWLEQENLSEMMGVAEKIMEDEIDRIVHNNAIKNNKRPDGRQMDELRKIECFSSLLPRVHGSGLFMRGNTQALSIVTLAAPSKELTIENIEVSGGKRFIHHYNFPSFSVGETKSSRGPGRREIGHGALAEKALRPIIPSKEDFPYTVRVVSEILSSNGSSSMASACGSSLALMDAGVPIKKPVAGIAMGLMMENENNYKILTDIQGPEDHYGDMDFKVAGTKDGVNACQMDVKIQGITLKIAEETLMQAKKARLEILEKITMVLDKPKPELSPYAPRIKTIQIKPDQIGMVIGSGGKTINDITAKTGAQIDIEETGLVMITGENEESAEKALKMVEAIVKEFEIGEIISGKVSKILDFGAVVDIAPNKDGLLHISEMAHKRVEKVEDIVKIGDEITVKIIRVDPDGRIGLSLKALEPAPENSGENTGESENRPYRAKPFGRRPRHDGPRRDSRRF